MRCENSFTPWPVCTPARATMWTGVNCPARIQGGATLESMLGLQDLMPTILEWTGLDIPEHLHGQSVVPLFAGESVRWLDVPWFAD